MKITDKEIINQAKLNVLGLRDVVNRFEAETGHMRKRPPHEMQRLRDRLRIAEATVERFTELTGVRP